MGIVKSTLALAILRRKLVKRFHNQQNDNSINIRSSDCFDLLQETILDTCFLYPTLLRALRLSGWATPAKNMFGSSSMRAEWPIQTIDRKSNQEYEQAINFADTNMSHDIKV